MIDTLFSFLYRLHLGILERWINDRSFDRNLSQAIDCLVYLIEYLRGRSKGTN